MDADESERVEVGVTLDQLVSDPGERSLHRRGVEQNLGRLAAGEMRCHLCSFPASLCRFKGVAGECRRRLRRSPREPLRGGSGGLPDGDQAIEPGDDPCRQLALGPRRAFRDLLRRKQVERRDVSAPDPRQSVFTADRQLGLQPSCLEARKPAAASSSCKTVGDGNLASSISRMEGKNGLSQYDAK